MRRHPWSQCSAECLMIQGMTFHGCNKRSVSALTIDMNNLWQYSWYQRAQHIHTDVTGQAWCQMSVTSVIFFFLPCHHHRSPLKFLTTSTLIWWLKSCPIPLSVSRHVNKLFTFQDVTSQGPFFTFFIPLFYLSQGEQITSKSVVYSAAHCAAVSAFCESIASDVAPFVRRSCIVLGHCSRVYQMDFVVV